MDSTTFNSQVTSVTFSEATFNVTISKISDCLPDFNVKLEEVASAVSGLLANPLVRGWIADKVNWAMQKIREAVTALFNKVTELVQGAWAPVAFFGRGWTWSDSVHAPMKDLKVAVAEDQLIDQDSWDGVGYRAYKKAVKDQSEASDAVSGIGSSMSNNLTVCAGAGLTFYVAVLGVAVKFVAGLVTASGAASTGVGAVPALAGTAANVGITAAEVGILLGALVICLGAQAAFMNNTKNALDSFPGAQWPNATKG